MPVEVSWLSSSRVRSHVLEHVCRILPDALGFPANQEIAGAMSIGLIHRLSSAFREDVNE